MKRLGKYVAVGAFFLFATGRVFAARVAEENVMGISLRLERTFAAPRDKLFGLWTDPKAVAQWFLPPDQAPWTEPPTFDLRAGGRFSLRLISREEFYDLHGTFREVRSPEKLVLNWQWDKDSPLAGSPGDTEVSIEFLALGARTDVVLTQFGFGNEESRRQYERGGTRCFREMDKLLAAVPEEINARSKEFIRVSSPIVALEHATVIDGTGASAKQDQTIVMANGRIAALGPSGTVDIPANAERVNLAGYTALPGLVGMHDHLFYASNFFNTFKLYTEVTRAEAKAAIDEAHRWGLTITGHLGSIGFREAAELGIDNVKHPLWVDTEFASDKQPDVCPPDNDASAVDLDVDGDAIWLTSRSRPRWRDGTICPVPTLVRSKLESKRTS